jgi:peptidoglycan hydrolase-like protein with peptidoglycan-binding domain
MPRAQNPSKQSLEKRLPRLLATSSIRPGSKGPGVAMLQQYLLKHGFLTSTVQRPLKFEPTLKYTELAAVFTETAGQARQSIEYALDTERGTFDRRTSDALQAFQAFHGLRTTGRIDRPTVDFLKLPRYDPHPDQPLFVVAAPWDHTNLTYAFLGGAHTIPDSLTHAVIRRAFDSWQSASKLTFTLVGADQKPDIKILWASGDHGDSTIFDGPLGILAHSDFPAPRGKTPGVLHFDDDEKWVDNPNGSLSKKEVDLVSIAAHEIGHCIGLDHSQDRQALMYAVYSAPLRDQKNQALARLSQDDFDGINALYV